MTERDLESLRDGVLTVLLICIGLLAADKYLGIGLSDSQISNIWKVWLVSTLVAIVGYYYERKLKKMDE